MTSESVAYSFVWDIPHLERQEILDRAEETQQIKTDRNRTHHIPDDKISAIRAETHTNDAGP